MKYTVAIPQLKALQDAFAKAPELVANEVMNAGNRSLVRYQATAKMKVRKDTAQLSNSLLIQPMTRRGNTIEGSMGTSVKHAIWNEQGTGIYGPHRQPIRPIRARVLAFTVGGKKVFAKQVKGMKPTWFMRDSIKQN